MSDLVMPPGRGLASAGALGKKRRPVRFGLATRVLILNTVFVIAAATITYVPAIATFRDNWLRHRLSAAYTAALVLDAAPQEMVPPELERQLLDSVGARIIVLSKHGTKQILAKSELPDAVNDVYDFREPAFLPLPEAITTLTAPPGRVITILGEAPRGGESIAITMDEAPLTKAMRAYSLRLLAVTLFVSVIVANLATVAIHFMVLRPVRRLTDRLIEFGTNPEHSARLGVPRTGGSHEIAHAEEELAIMQDALVRELNEKKHLAALGLAVAKINHDMRNMLTSAQLLSDRLANVDDPLAQRLAPKLVATLDRAIRFCQATLTYGRAVDDPPSLAHFNLHGLAAEVMEMVGLEARGEVEFVNAVGADFEIVADREQMFRVLMNLVRNGAEALENMRAELGRPKRISVDSWVTDKNVVIEVADTGPGVPAAARERLFTPFSSSRAGGSGLGMVIAADLVRGHGGAITLVTGADERDSGATFQITMPQDAGGKY
ncbi:MAG: HAMP domain-containing histidine kinase [Beijerinckiaceae bacterium]|nr:HAMP domain-containing histidine kinase [Beijerinckiaceae bacterium]MCI0734982.1 HAMP domain-containing histidine kinase [Beijerinckiaceae bacterium]